MTRHYTGVGSRSTPFAVQREMKKLGEIFAQTGYVLRSGGAAGADSAFEAGCHVAHGLASIFLPWPRFKHHSSTLYNIGSDALDMAAKYHPAWHRCSSAARKLHARNCYQVLGRNLDTPSRFVICWTPNAEITGGTGMAIRLANANNIPVFNLADRDDRNQLVELLVHDSIVDFVTRPQLPAPEALPA